MRRAGALAREEVLLHLARALWEIPTPELRFITLTVGEQRVDGRFGYDAPVDDDVRELVSLAETYLYADFASPPGVLVTFRPEHVPQDEPRELRDGEEWCYLRHEPPVDGRAAGGATPPQRAEPAGSSAEPPAQTLRTAGDVGHRLPSKTAVRLGLQRALWNIPTPELRFVTLRARGWNVAARFVYDTPIDAHVRALVAQAEACLRADLDPAHRIAFTPEHAPTADPRWLHAHERLHHWRYEPPPDA